MSEFSCYANDNNLYNWIEFSVVKTNNIYSLMWKSIISYDIESNFIGYYDIW